MLPVFTWPRYKQLSWSNELNLQVFAVVIVHPVNHSCVKRGNLVYSRQQLVILTIMFNYYAYLHSIHSVDIYMYINK